MPPSHHSTGFGQTIFARLLLPLALAALILTGIAKALPAADGSLLWGVDAGEGSVTLMGSVHTLRSTDFPLPSAHEREYEKASAVVFETDLARMNDPAVQARLLELGLYPEGESLRDHLTPEAKEALASALKSRGMTLEQFARFRPWFCAFTLTMLELNRLGFSTLQGLDLHFFTRASEDGKEVLHLESAEDQISHLASIGRGDQEALLLQSLQELDVLESRAASMTEAWRAGDAEALHEIILMGFKGFPDIYDQLLVQRNRDWLPRIEDLVKRGDNILVIVGSGHLVGPESLVQMLKDSGYRVERL
jgi:uncharacterized protein